MKDMIEIIKKEKDQSGRQKIISDNVRIIN